MANEAHVRASLQAAHEVGAAILVAGTTETARLQAELDTLTEAVRAHLAIASGEITGGVVSPSLLVASLLDLRRLVQKDEQP